MIEASLSMSPEFQRKMAAMEDMDFKKLGIWDRTGRFIQSNIMDEHFKKEMGTSKWRQLSPKYKAYKSARFAGNRTPSGKRSRAKNKKPRHNTILQWSGRLAAAARGGRGSFMKTTKNVLRLGIKGSVIEYAGAHQEGTRTIPARPYYVLNKSDIRQIKRLIKGMLVEIFGGRT